MNRKILVILAILTVGLTAVSVVSADTVVINDVDLNLPEGYALVYEDSASAYNQTGAANVFQNENNTTVTIGVLDNALNLTLQDIAGLSDYHAVNKTIAGKEGILTNDDTNTTFTFIYLKDSKIIMIVADNESIIEEFVK